MATSLLLIDDDPHVSRAIRRALEHQDHTIATATTGREGVERFANGSFDVVLLDLKQRVKEGRFRSDLYYRIAAHTLVLPPLRERGPDAVADLAYRILADLRRRAGQAPPRISDAALDRLAAHEWPGDVRELRNVLEHALMKACSAPEILPRHLPLELAPAGPAAPAGPVARDLAGYLAAAERGHIQAVIAECGGNRSRAARELRISRATLYEKLKRLGIDG